MKYTSSIIFILSLLFASCSDKNDEPKSNESKIIGYWAITRIQSIEHIGNNHNTTDRNIPPHGTDSNASDYNYRYDVLIFDEDLVTIRGDLPNRPKGIDYDLDTLDGQIQYANDLNNWELSIGQYSDNLGCPVGTYSIQGNNLIIGSISMGTITFSSENEFTLDYKKSLNGKGDYRRHIYTYTRIYSLVL